MSYTRVIPRDLFNEASLLKCNGALFIALERCNGAARFSVEDLSSFDIVQRQDDGAIYVENLTLFIGDVEYRLTRPLNSRQPWPLYAEAVDNVDWEPVMVFADDGSLSLEFADLLVGSHVCVDQK